MITRLRRRIRWLLGRLHILEELAELEAQVEHEKRELADMRESTQEFDEKISQMRASADRKAQRLRFLELQVKAIQSRSPKRRPPGDPPAAA